MTRGDWLKAAKMWNATGVSVVPAIYKQKRAAIPWKHWALHLPSHANLEQWANTEWPCNLAVILSAPGGITPLVVLDFDDRSAYFAWRKRHPILSDTYTVRTGRGVHAYILVGEGVRRTVGFTFMGRPAGEIKASGYVIGWPSIHPNGTMYKVMNNVPIQEVFSARRLGVKPVVNHMDEISSESPRMCGDGIVSRIKHEIPVQIYLSKFTDIRLRSDGTYIGICPFHDDTNPSMQVWPAEGRFYCHSPQCRAHRKCDVISACAFAHNISMSEAVSLLAREVE